MENIKEIKAIECSRCHGRVDSRDCKVVMGKAGRFCPKCRTIMYRHASKRKPSKKQSEMSVRYFTRHDYV